LHTECSGYRRALLKLHFELGPLTGTVMLSVGLLTEALIFALSALNQLMMN
jgi:hypothetical protein